MLVPVVWFTYAFLLPKDKKSFFHDIINPEKSNVQ